MNEPWYEVAAPEISITQGDIIDDCPLLTWNMDALPQGLTPDPAVLQRAVSAFRADVVVMTQACDLEHDKVRNVILCPHVSLDEYRVLFEHALRAAGQNPTVKAWKRHCDDIRDGFVWNLAMLNGASDREMESRHRVVDFHEVFTLPRAFLESYISLRNKSRLRLLPPYREHLSQAFARFFMRVGLPTPVVTAW